MNKPFLSALSAAILLTSSEFSWAATYYVAASGSSDSNPGTEAAPWATVQKAASVLTAGDTVYIKNGIYALNSHPITKYLALAGSGNAASGWITFAAYPGHALILVIVNYK